MNRQEKVEFLKRYIPISNRINRKIEEKSYWWAKVTKTTPTYSDMPKGGEGKDKIQTYIEKIEEIEKEIDDSIDELIKVKAEIEAAIESVPNEKFKELLEYWYIDGKKPWEISRKMNYDVEGKNIYKMHRKAIDLVKVDTRGH